MMTLQIRTQRRNPHGPEKTQIPQFFPTIRTAADPGDPGDAGPVPDDAGRCGGLLLCAAGTALLVLKQEHKRRRSWWLLASFAGLLACTLVSLIVGFPAPPVS